MPAIDNCEPQVIRALEKDGWRVIERPVQVRLHGKILYADLLLERAAQPTRLLVVEVKCFPESQLAIDHLYRALGQYLLYRSVIAERPKDISLVLSSPNEIYNDLILP